MLVRWPSTVFGGDEQRGRHLLRLEALRREFGHTAFRWRELARGGSPAAHAAELRAGPLRPDLCAHLFEDRERGLERLARGALVPSAAVDGAVGQQCTALLERVRDLRAQLHGSLELRERGLEVAALGVHQTAAASRGCQRRGTAEILRVVRVPVEHLSGGIQFANADEGLDVIRDDACRARLADPLPTEERDEGTEHLCRLGGSAERDLKEAECGQREVLRWAPARAVCDGQGALRLARVRVLPHRRRRAPARAAPAGRHPAWPGRLAR